MGVEIIAMSRNLVKMLPLTSERALSEIANSRKNGRLKVRDFKVGIIAEGSVEASAAAKIAIDGRSADENVPIRVVNPVRIPVNNNVEITRPKNERESIGKNHFLKFLKGTSSPPANRIMAPNTSITSCSGSRLLVKMPRIGCIANPAKIAHTKEGIRVFGAMRLSK